MRPTNTAKDSIDGTQVNITSTQAQVDVTNVSKIPTQNQFVVNGKPLDNIPNDDQMDDESNGEEVILPAVSSAAKCKKVSPIVVAGSNATSIQNMLTAVVTSKKFEIKITSIGIRINLTNQYDFTKVKLKLKQIAESKEIIGFYNYYTADTRPHKIVEITEQKRCNSD